MKKIDLIQIALSAIKSGNDLKVEVTIPGQEDTEYIINKNKSIENKLKYYCETYDDDLCHKKNPSVKIIGAETIIYNKENEENSYNPKKEIVCEKCDEKFIVDKETERDYGEYGIPYVRCPFCDSKVYLDDEEALKINDKNIIFPDHFFQFGGKDAVNINRHETEGWVKDVLSALIKDKELPFYYIGSGDTIVIGFQDEEEIHIVVGKGYYSFDYEKEE